jgi:hypothetical protein
MTQSQITETLSPLRDSVSDFGLLSFVPVSDFEDISAILLRSDSGPIEK